MSARRSCWTIALSITLAGPAWAQSPDARVCEDKLTTVDMVQCLAGEAAKWEAKIDSAMGELPPDETSEQTAALKTAQDLWTKYRDANCLAYRLGEGTIAAIEAAECRLRMAKQRLGEINTGGEE